MGSLPFKSKIFLFAVYAAGASAVLTTYFVLPVTLIKGEWWELFAFAVLGAVLGKQKVNLMRVKDNDLLGSMSLGFAIVFASLLRFGPQGAVLVGVITTLASCLFPPYPVFQLLFNVAVSAIETLIGGVVFMWLNGHSLALSLSPSFPAIVASSLAFFFVNTGPVATIIAFCSGEVKPLAVWRESFLWTGPSYFIGALFSTTAVFLVGDSMFTTLACAVPVALLTHRSFKAYTERAAALVESKEKLANLYLSTIRSLALAIDAKDQYTHQHILRVQQYAVATAKQMDITGDDLSAIETGALLHDIGKLGVPEYVLLKPGRLTDEEFAKIKEHPRIGADILDPVPFPWPVTPIVKHHHERWDGRGYPAGLKGEEIPLNARILAVADAYDAMTSNRSYRNALPHERAIAEIRNGVGTMFDGNVVTAFLAVIDTVVDEMASNGYGPRAVASQTPAPGGAATAGIAATVTTARAEEAARDIQRASSELWALYEVAQTLSASLGLQDTLDILGRKLEAILPGTACVFLLRDTEADSLRAQTAVGINRGFFDGCCTTGPDSLSLRVARDCATYLGTFDPQDVLPQSQPGAVWTEIRTAMIVPIIHQGEVLGTINLYHPQTNAFGPHDQNLLEMIAERAALALYNGLLFDRTRQIAATDPLTGLANTRHFTQHIAERCASEAPKRFVLLCLDLDNFKPINENFGHLKGDEILRDLSRLFEKAVRKSDVVVRYGGDEFLILLDDAGPEEAKAMVRRIQESVAFYEPGLFHSRLGALRIGVSIGYACFPTDGADFARLLTVADAAMKKAKSECKLGHLADPWNLNLLFAKLSDSVPDPAGAADTERHALLTLPPV